MNKIQELCYETEKTVIELVEQELKKQIHQIKLTEKQSKKLQKWLKRFSHFAPYEFRRK